MAQKVGGEPEFDYDKEHLYEALCESTDDYVYVGNMKTGTFRYPPAMIEEFDFPGEIVPDAAEVFGSLIHPDDKHAFLEANREVAEGKTEYHNVEYRAMNRKGKWVWLRCRGHMIRDEYGTPSLFAGIITNLGRKNRVDHMTGLGNKLMAEDDVRRMVADYPDIPFGLMLLGIDDFKHINDLYDRIFGDEVIRIVSQKLYTLLDDNMLLYRMDGDEYCILIKNAGTKEFDELYRKIQKTFSIQQEYDGKKYYCTLSAGCARFPAHGRDYLGLIKSANYALEYSKGRGKNCMTEFSGGILAFRERSLELIERLRESVDNGFSGFQLNYQPQVRAVDGVLIGAEALARWRCDKYGAVSPAEFIPLMEESGLIVPLGKWIFREAVRKCRDWRRKQPDFVMSINLSYLQIIEPDFMDFVKDTMEESGLPYRNLSVELTETYLVKEMESVQEVFQKIQKLGIRVAMDDFGTGYSSLGVLKDTPVDVVKIDQTFVRGIGKDRFDATFIRFIVALCHDVGKTVCLEGVETEEEYQIVMPSRPEYIQGFYFGRPVAEDVFEETYFR